MPTMVASKRSLQNSSSFGFRTSDTPSLKTCRKSPGPIDAVPYTKHA